MNKHEQKFRQYLASQTAEEVAQDEDRIMRDSVRMERLSLIKYMRELIEETGGTMNELKTQLTEAFDNVVTVLALFKRSEVTARVVLKYIQRNKRN